MENIAPTFTQINGKTEVNEGEAVNYNATATDAGTDGLTYTWDFGDGTNTIMGENVLKDVVYHGYTCGYTLVVYRFAYRTHLCR